MGLVRLLIAVGIMILMIAAAGLAWIFAWKYVALGIIILVVWNAYKKSEKNERKDE